VIGWSPGWRSARGLLDYSDPSIGRDLRAKLDALCQAHGLRYHGVRFRTTGYRLMVELHLLFPSNCSIGEAHRLATLLEERLPDALGAPTEVITHLESIEDHAEVHRHQHYTGTPA
jgi:divalent metal cation (Fe/Co/Zn/Cd) transporter